MPGKTVKDEWAQVTYRPTGSLGLQCKNKLGSGELQDQ